MKDSRIAILGGSFDPVHLGHLFLLHCAVSMTDYNSFMIIPAKLSNFKQNSMPKASDEERLEMLGLAMMDYMDIYSQDFCNRSQELDIKISPIELERGGVSYTSDTVRRLKEMGYSDIGLIMGDDHIAGLSKWHEFDYLKENIEFLICRRSPEGTPWNLIPEGVRVRRLEPKEVYPQSSSAVRTDLDGKLDYLSERVREYVKAKHLYV